MRVTRVELALRTTTQGKTINRVTFQSPGGEPYIAEEAVEVPEGMAPASGFKQGQMATFVLANKGLGGKLDWVRYVGPDSQPVVSQSAINTQYLIVAQVAFKGAIDIVASTGGTREEVLPIAEQFAHDIFYIAQNLQSLQI